MTLTLNKPQATLLLDKTGIKCFNIPGKPLIVQPFLSVSIKKYKAGSTKLPNRGFVQKLHTGLHCSVKKIEWCSADENGKRYVNIQISDVKGERIDISIFKTVFIKLFEEFRALSFIEGYLVNSASPYFVITDAPLKDVTFENRRNLLNEMKMFVKTNLFDKSEYFSKFIQVDSGIKYNCKDELKNIIETSNDTLLVIKESNEYHSCKPTGKFILY